jgi:hypothetical protein
MLRHYVSKKQNDWDEILTMAEFAVNNAKQASTRTTPFMLNAGQHPLVPATLTLPSRVPAAREFAEGMREALATAKSCLHAAQDRQKSHADTKRRDVFFAVGEQVLLKTTNIALKRPSGGTRKLMPKWIGPFPIQAVVGNPKPGQPPRAVRLQLPDSMGAIHPVFHVSLLRLYKDSGTQKPPPAPVEVDGELEYVVEDVLNHRWVRAGGKYKLQYLIKWLGYPDEENCWEDAEGLSELEAAARYEASTDMLADKPAPKAGFVPTPPKKRTIKG